MTNTEIEIKCKELGIPFSELQRYNESHRFYHNWNHINVQKTNFYCTDISELVLDTSDSVNVGIVLQKWLIENKLI